MNYLNNLLIIILFLIIFSLKRFIPIELFRNSKNHTIKIIKIGKSHEEKRTGLMYVKNKLPENSGMLFVYKYPTKLSFWMKNTYIDLDILFLDKNYRVLGSLENMKKHSLESRSIDELSNYAIELNAGTINKNNIKKNDFVRLIYGLSSK